MKTLNKQIAILPFKKEQDKPKAKGIDFSNTIKLISSEVVFDSEKYTKRTKLYFRSEIERMPFVNQKFELDGLTFILVPEEAVILAEDVKKI